MLAKRLVQLRNALGLTQEEISSKLNISRGTYAHYEIGKRNPDYETLQKIADFFSVTTDYLLGRTDNPKPIIQNAPDGIQPTPPDRYRTFQKKIEELSPESLTFLDFHLDRLRELDLEAVERRRAKRDARNNKK